MNKHYDDRNIAVDFDQLRKAELDLTPPFSNLLKDTDRGKPHFGLLQPSAGIAVVVLTLSILAGIVLRPYNKDSDQSYSEDSMQLSLVDELSTDFLLETPWSQLASLGPEPQLIDLPYEYLEELTDEP